MDQLDVIEKREEHLWFVALLVLFLLAVGLFTLDYLGGAAPGRGPLASVMDNTITRSALLLVVLLICGYFQEKVVSLRRDNRELVRTLRANQEHLEKKSRQLVKWGELSHALITNFELQRLLDLIVTTAKEVTGADRASLLLLEDNQQELRVAAAAGIDHEELIGRKVKVGESIAGWVTAEGEPVLLSSTNPDPRLAGWMRRREEIPWAIAVPLRIQQRVAGTLNVSRGEGGQGFTQEDVRSLMLFADQGALAIERAELYRDSQAQLERLLNMLEELERTQAQLVQSEKLASIGLLAGGVAHEINNPLMVILGKVELAMMSEQLDPVTQADLDTIREETVRIAGIVRNLLQFSRESSNVSFELLDINQVMERTLALTEHQMGLDNIVVIRRLEEHLPQIRGNAGQLQQVFTNLIVNAGHAMPHGGTLTITTAEAGPGQVLIEFIDTGIGIAPENLGKIFDPFFTTKDEGHGTGLGLAVSYGIIQNHGGCIGVTSRLGEGACFTIQLPTTEAVPAAEVPPAKEALTV